MAVFPTIPRWRRFFWGQTPFGGQSPQVDTAALLHFLAGWDLIAGEFAASGVAEPSVAPAQLLGPGDGGFQSHGSCGEGTIDFFQQLVDLTGFGQSTY